MFKHILVPLDGSSLAEAALPPAASLSQLLKAPVTLLHVIEKDAPDAVHKDRHLTRADEAEEYLEKIASGSFSKDIKIERHVHSAQVKDVVASIVEHISEFKSDLIVMCAHGKTGFRDIVFGNIAQQILAQNQTPLLLLQPKAVDKKPFLIRRILLPLDSESMHDQSLSYAQELARIYQAEVYLLTVIPTFGTLAGEQAATSNLLPATTVAFLDIIEENTRKDLQTHLDELQAVGLKARAEIVRGDPATVIADSAKRVDADMIILSTHRKAGISAFWARSTAPNVLQHTTKPILLIPL